MVRPHPPPAPFGPEFGWLMLTALPNVSVVALPRFNVPRGRFGAFHEGMNHFSHDPLLSTYKRDSLLLIQQQHTREHKSIKEQEQNHDSMGLGPS